MFAVELNFVNQKIIQQCESRYCVEITIQAAKICFLFVNISILFFFLYEFNT